MIDNQMVGDEDAYFFDEDFKPSQGTVPMAKIRGRLGRRDGNGDKYPCKNGRDARSGVSRRS